MRRYSMKYRVIEFMLEIAELMHIDIALPEIGDMALRNVARNPRSNRRGRGTLVQTGAETATPACPVNNTFSGCKLFCNQPRRQVANSGLALVGNRNGIIGHGRSRTDARRSAADAGYPPRASIGAKWWQDFYYLKLRVGLAI